MQGQREDACRQGVDAGGGDRGDLQTTLPRARSYSSGRAYALSAAPVPCKPCNHVLATRYCGEQRLVTVRDVTLRASQATAVAS
jgi:hypothetical protein